LCHWIICGIPLKAYLVAAIKFVLTMIAHSYCVSPKTILLKQGCKITLLAACGNKNIVYFAPLKFDSFLVAILKHEAHKTRKI
jgi:hypothetical protein